MHRSSTSKLDESTDELVEIPGPQIIHPVLIEPPPLSHIQSAEETKPGEHSFEDVKEWTKNPITPHVLVEMIF